MSTIQAVSEKCKSIAKQPKYVLAIALVMKKGVMLRTDLRNVGLLESMSNRGERRLRYYAFKWRVVKSLSSVLYSIRAADGHYATLLCSRKLRKGQVLYTRTYNGDYGTGTFLYE